MAAIKTKGTTRARAEVKGDEQLGEIRCTYFERPISSLTVSNV